MKALSTPLSYEQPPLECAARRGGERDASQPQTATRGITRRMPRSAVAPRPCASTPPLRHCLSRAGALARPPPASGRRCRREHAAPHLASREVHVTGQRKSAPPAARPAHHVGSRMAHEGSIVPTRAQLCRMSQGTPSHAAHGGSPTGLSATSAPPFGSAAGDAQARTLASRPPATHPVDVAAVDAYLLR